MFREDPPPPGCGCLLAVPIGLLMWLALALIVWPALGGLFDLVLP